MLHLKEIIIIFADFSATNWLEQQGITDLSSMTDLLVAKLADTLGISQYYQEKECDIDSHPYSKNIDGWNKCKLLLIYNLMDCTFREI